MITQGSRPGRIRADVVALDQRVRGRARIEQDSFRGIAGDDVACPRRRTANRVVDAIDDDAIIIGRRAVARGGLLVACGLDLPGTR